MKHITRILTYCFGWPLTAVAFFYVGKMILSHTTEITASADHLNWTLLLLGLLCYTVYFFIRAFFWQKLLRIKGHKLPFKEVSYIWGITEVKRFIPGNIWSLLARAHSFSKKEITATTTVSFSLVEALYITAASALLSLFSLNFIIFGLLPPFQYQYLAVWIITIAVWGGTIALVCNATFLKHIPFIKKFVPDLSWQENLSLLVISTLSLFLFGLGTYFTISSITLLYVAHLSTLIGFFIFSLLVGYLSFITPMGLGVREGIMTIGLSKYIPEALAGFGAIFARIMFIFAEILFIILSYLWDKGKHPFIIKCINTIHRYRYEIVLGVCICLYILYFTTATFVRYDNFYAGRFDLGNMDQTVWNTLHGRIFQLTDPNGTNIISRLAFHADFILILLAPFYFLWQDPRMLLLIQTIVLASGSIFVYLIAKHTLNKKSIALLFAFVYLINPSMNHSNLYDFHGVTLATTFLLGAFYFLKKKYYIWYILFLILAGITKEEVWLVTALFGLYTIFFMRKRILGSTIFIISSWLAYFLVTKAIPQALGGEHFALGYYSDFGSSPGNIIKNIIFSPIKTVTILLGKSQLSYLFEIFFPLGFLALIGLPFLIFAAPDLGVDLLSNNTHLHEIYYQYTAIITPFIIIASIYGFLWITKRFVFIQEHILIKYLLMCSLLAAYFFGPLPGAKNANVTMFASPLQEKNIIEDFIQHIPKKLSVASTNNLGSHLSRRQNIYTIPVGIDKADIILFLLNDYYAQPSLEDQIAMSEKMKHDKNYIEIFRLNDFVVFEKRNLYMHKKPIVDRVKLNPISLPALQQRDYTGGNIILEKTISNTATYTTYQISYPSDGLTIYGILSIPQTPMPINGYPVIIMNHDINPPDDLTEQQTATYFVSHGYLVLQPDYRSDTDTPTYPIDVLNLFSSVPTLIMADPNNIFLWGQGKGALLTLSEIIAQDKNTNTIYPIRAVSLWSTVADPYTTYPTVATTFGTPKQNPFLWQSINPLFYLEDINTPIQISHGLQDQVVPFETAIELYDMLKSMNKQTSLRLYRNTDHTMQNAIHNALRDTLEFFDKHASESAKLQPRP